jgi:pilus assembly protein CpaB
VIFRLTGGSGLGQWIAPWSAGILAERIGRILAEQIGTEHSMNRRLSTILFAAFVVAAISSYLVYRIAGRQMHPAQAPTTVIVVAAQDLPIGTLIKDGDLATTQWMGTPPKGSIVSKEAAIGRGVVSELYQGEPIFDSRLAAVGSGGGMAATIRPGMRACAVRVDDVVGVAGFVTPGMRVDVLVSGTGPGTAPAEGPKVKTLLQNIEVLSAGTNIQKDNEGKAVNVAVVNLLVTPQQAELLSLASSQTKIQLVLRNPLDTDTAKTPSIAMASVFSDGEAVAKPKNVVFKKPAPVVQAPLPPSVYLVQVLNGGKHTEEKFPDPQHQ